MTMCAATPRGDTSAMRSDPGADPPASGEGERRRPARRGWPGVLFYVLVGVAIGIVPLGVGSPSLADKRPLRDLPGELVVLLVPGVVVAIWVLGRDYRGGSPGLRDGIEDGGRRSPYHRARPVDEPGRVGREDGEASRSSSRDGT
jgi:hypothetical protein